MIHLNKVLVREVMVKDPHTILLQERFSKVEELFRTHGIRHLPVVDGRGMLRGIVSQRDLYRVLSPRKDYEGNWVYDPRELDKFILEHVMSKEMITVKPEDTLGHVVDIMVTRKYGCVPVVDVSGGLAGILTQIDVLRAIRDYFL